MLKKYAFYLAASAMLTFSGHPISDAFAQATSGTVLEAMNAAGYTYFLVDSGSQKEWVAIPEATVAVGDKVNYNPGMEMKDFHSKTLDRTFPTIIFSPGLVGEQQVAATAETPAAPATDDSFAAAVAREQQALPAASATMPETSGGSTGAVVPATEVVVEKAPGDNSYTVEEIFTEAEKLNGKKVRLSGKVVKFNANIMGKNWVHLQDGSGNPMNNTHDLVITTSETVTMNDIVIFEGVLAANKDFGAGYNYAALVEEAQIIK